VVLSLMFFKINCSLLQREVDEATIKQLQLDLAARESHITALSEKLGQDLKDWIVVEQEEKNEMHKKLQNVENEYLRNHFNSVKLMKIRQVEQLKDSISIHHVEILMQKIIKLRKENESLKRRLLASEFSGAGN
ncbi:hypothetical protein ACMD2_19936, partial [Ananas comosus]